MIVTVLDTNVLAAGFAGYARADSIPGELLRRWRANDYLLIVSEPILTELARTVRNPYFIRRISDSEAEAAFIKLRDEGTVQPISVHVVGVAAHPPDDLILATALSARASFIVTGDKPLLKRGSCQGTRLLTPRQFLAVVDGAPR